MFVFRLALSTTDRGARRLLVTAQHSALEQPNLRFSAMTTEPPRIYTDNWKTGWGKTRKVKWISRKTSCQTALHRVRSRTSSQLRIQRTEGKKLGTREHPRGQNLRDNISEGEKFGGILNRYLTSESITYWLVALTRQTPQHPQGYHL